MKYRQRGDKLIEEENFGKRKLLINIIEYKNKSEI